MYRSSSVTSQKVSTKWWEVVEGKQYPLCTFGRNEVEWAQRGRKWQSDRPVRVKLRSKKICPDVLRENADALVMPAIDLGTRS